MKYYTQNLGINSKYILNVGEKDTMDVGTAHGVEYDEVYVDIPYEPTPSITGKNYSRLNKKMYQAISRSTEYVEVLSSAWIGAESISDIDDTIIKTERENKFLKNRQSYEKKIQDDIVAMSGKEETEEKADTTVEEVPGQTAEDVSETPEDENEDNDVESGEKIISTDEEEHTNLPVEINGDEKTKDIEKKFETLNSHVTFHYDGVKEVKEGSILDIFYEKDKVGDGIHKIYMYKDDKGLYHEVMTSANSKTEEEIRKDGDEIIDTDDRNPEEKPIGTAKVTYVHLLSFVFDKVGKIFNDIVKRDNEKKIKKGNK